MYYNEDDNDDNIIEDRVNKTNNTNLDLNVSISSEFSNAYSDIEQLDGNDSIIDDDESELILHESNLKIITMLHTLFTRNSHLSG